MSIRSDYKPASAWQRRRRTARRHGLLVMTLALIGLFGGLLAYIRSTPPTQAALAEQPPPQALAKSAASPAPTTATAHTVAAPATTAHTAPTPASVAPHTAAVTASAAHTPVAPVAPEKPKYDFYTELPKRQVDVPQEKAASPTAPSRQFPTRTQPPATPAHKRTLPDDTKPQTAATRSTAPAQHSTASTGTTNRVTKQPTAASPPALRPLPQTTVAAKIQ